MVQKPVRSISYQEIWICVNFLVNRRVKMRKDTLYADFGQYFIPSLADGCSI